MAVRIRLKRMGAKKKPFNRIVVCDSRRSPGGKFIETIGTYDPKTTPEVVKVNKDRALYWLKVGAKPTETVKSIFKKEKIKL